MKRGDINAILVYFDFLRKRQMEPVKRSKRSDDWIIKNNGEIVYPYTEAEHKGIGRIPNQPGGW